MGSNAGITLQDEEITVLVTGFRPFKEFALNPSWEIAKALPTFLPPPSSTNAADISTLATQPPIRILVHPEPVRVVYRDIRELVPTLWTERKIHYAVHIGMAVGRRFYSVERRAHRDGYSMEDSSGEFLGDYSKRKQEGSQWIWDGLPEELLTSVDVEDVWRRWRLALPNTDVRISEDAGRWTCDFIYFSSLAYLTKNGEERRVVFLHVPIGCDANSIKTGVEVTVELIRAMVQSGRAKKGVQ